MSTRNTAAARAASCLLATAVIAAWALAADAPAAPTKIEPRWNRFSEADDIEIGKKSAAEAEKKLKLLDDPKVTGYVQEIAGKLVAAAKGPKFPYTFKVVDDK